MPFAGADSWKVQEEGAVANELRKRGRVRGLEGVQVTVVDATSARVQKRGIRVCCDVLGESAHVLAQRKLVIRVSPLQSKVQKVEKGGRPPSNEARVDVLARAYRLTVLYCSPIVGKVCALRVWVFQFVVSTSFLVAQYVPDDVRRSKATAHCVAHSRPKMILLSK